MAESAWEFGNITNVQIEQDLIRGTYRNTIYNDQLYIWVREEDVEQLQKHLTIWLNIKETQKTNYSITTVTINLEKTYPISVIYRTGSPKIGEISMKELGNVYLLESERVKLLNSELADFEKFDIKFGNNRSKSMNSAFDMGMRFQRYIRDIEELGYTMISTVESGLITYDLMV